MSDPELRRVRLRVNDVPRTVRVEPRRTLLDCLREDLFLTGTHAGCEHGVCGCCNVLLDGAVVRSCLLFAAQLDGCDVRTVEGLERDGELSPLQQAFCDHHALQCGYCTPGFLLAATALLEENPAPSEAEVREGLSGNLCRCTGYQQIVDAVLDAAARGRNPGPPP